VDYISRIRGYAVVPAAPALANIQRDENYRRALVESDLAIADSGFMVLLWRILRRRKITRTSGLKYLKLLVADRVARSSGKTFLVLPSEIAREKALAWLTSQRFQIDADDCYIAPLYGNEVKDAKLIERLNERKPDHVIVAIGGGTQEKLGYYLREHLNYRPAIHCIGAALGFLTGDQPPIPMWADRFYLGWLVRVISNPRRFFPRYLNGVGCFFLIIRFGSQLPPSRPEVVCHASSA
jgi:exopolysaccharide biosynthesis WecB/TagA/CpsF family protein